jgi:hypothetical protein
VVTEDSVAEHIQAAQDSSGMFEGIRASIDSGSWVVGMFVVVAVQVCCIAVERNLHHQILVMVDAAGYPIGPWPAFLLLP